MVEATLRVPALEKLVDYAASGIGSIAGSMLAPWRAGREAEARRIAARGDADVLAILAEGQAGALPVIAEAQENARRRLANPEVIIEGEFAVTEVIEQRVRFQEEKRQQNIAAIVTQAAAQLPDGEVEDREPDHDWTARFFSEAQDVSSEQMQLLWAKVLAGEVEHQGSTSVQTLGILKNLDRKTAEIFARLCSACVYLIPNERHMFDARVLSLGSSAGSNVLAPYGFDYATLNLLNEHGLIISDYHSWRDYGPCVRHGGDAGSVLPLRYQDRYWVLDPMPGFQMQDQIRLHGVSLTSSGRELASIVGCEPADDYTAALSRFLQSQKLRLQEVEFVPPPQPE